MSVVILTRLETGKHKKHENKMLHSNSKARKKILTYYNGINKNQ